MPSGPEPAGHAVPAAGPEQLAAALPELLSRALRVRVYDPRGPVEMAAKRRQRTESSLLRDMTDGNGIATLIAALRLRPDIAIMEWMQWPTHWIEFTDEHGASLVTLGLLYPDWLRWEPYGDLKIAAPEAIEKLFSSWGLAADRS